MKALIKNAVAVLSCIICLASYAGAQSPVLWKYTAVKIDASTYEIHMTASIAEGWHIYSQFQPQDAIAIPAKIRIKANPLIKLEGDIEEVGQKQKQTIEGLDIVQYQFTNKVDFVQRISVKANVKTNCTGTVTFQACTDKQCLPPKEETFAVAF